MRDKSTRITMFWVFAMTTVVTIDSKQYNYAISIENNNTIIWLGVDFNCCIIIYMYLHNILLIINY